MNSSSRRGKKMASSTARGLGYRHRQAVEALKRRHVDGSRCDWCGKPLWLDETKNWDYDPAIPGSGKLQGDHGAMTRAEAVRRGVPIPLADRLLHRRCNQQRGDGVNDHLAAVNRGSNADAGSPRTRLLMDWPWPDTAS